MADNVTFQSTTPATPPASTVISTEEVTTLNGGAVAAQQAQRVLLAVRTADATAVDLVGQKARVSSMPVALSIEDAALLADLLTNTAFQARIPTTGQKAMAASVPMVIASDQTAVAVTPAKGTKTFSTAAPTNAAASILAANASRKTALIVNAGSVTVYLGKDNTVTTSNGIPLAVGAAIEDDRSTDAWYGITASSTGDLRILEVA